MSGKISKVINIQIETKMNQNQTTSNSDKIMC